MQRCASPQFQKLEPLIYLHAQDDYGSELGEDFYNTICKPDLIQISQESAHTTGLLEQFIQHLALWNLTKHTYQPPTMVFLKLIVNRIRHNMT